MKTCTACLRTLPPSKFYKNPITLDGLGSHCRSCDRAGRSFRHRDRKARLVNELGGVCTRCGYSECIQALHFHHHSGDKEADVSTLLRRSYEKARNEAQKCTLVCANCHTLLHLQDTPEYKGKIRGGPIPHGTMAGYRRCGKPACPPCREAYNKHMQEYRRRRRQANSLG